MEQFLTDDDLLGLLDGSLTLDFNLHFHYHLYYSLLRLIFLSNFKFSIVIVCNCGII